MIPPDTRAHENERTIAILAPGGRDAELLLRAAGAGGPAFAAAGPGDLVAALRSGRADVLVITHEGLTPDLVETLAAATVTSDPWDEIPVLVLVDADANSPAAVRRLEEALPRMRVLLRQRPVRPVELMGTLAQMRRTRAQQLDLSAHIERERELRRELNHRVKNILASVQGLYQMSARTSVDEMAFHETFEGRLSAMAQVHAVLFAQDYGTVDLCPVLEAMLEPYRATSGPGPVQIDCAPVEIDAEAAQALALLVHELATNATKHGSLTRGDGRVRLHVRVGGDDLRLDWSESGGPPAAEPERTGFGTRFIRSTVRQWGGTAIFHFEPSGLRVSISIPLAAVSADVPGHRPQTRSQEQDA